jgi:ribosomal-protein-alanine N-acetyltransferase
VTLDGASIARELRSIETERLLLRMAQAGDVAAIVRYFHENAAHLASSHPAWPQDFFTDAFWAERVRLEAEDFARGLAVRFLLFERERISEVVGSVRFSNIVRGPLQACFLGYHVAASKQGLGLGTEAVRAAIAWAFDQLGLHRICANYEPANERSGKLLRRLGFTIEGYARDYLFLDGRWRDHILTSLINPHGVSQ